MKASLKSAKYNVKAIGTEGCEFYFTVELQTKKKLTHQQINEALTSSTLRSYPDAKYLSSELTAA